MKLIVGEGLSIFLCLVEQSYLLQIPDKPSPASTECLTVKGDPCVFPFSYQGGVYDACTRDDSDNGAAWCAVQVTQYGLVLQGKWEDCAQGCPGNEVACSNSSTLCSQLKPHSVCNPLTGQCECDQDHPVELDSKQCVPGAVLGGQCQDDAQCQHQDPHAGCTLVSDTTACTCQARFYQQESQCVPGVPHIPDENISPGFFLFVAPLLLGCVLCYTARLVWLARLDHHRKLTKDITVPDSIHEKDVPALSDKQPSHPPPPRPVVPLLSPFKVDMTGQEDDLLSRTNMSQDFQIGDESINFEPAVIPTRGIRRKKSLLHEAFHLKTFDDSSNLKIIPKPHLETDKNFEAKASDYQTFNGDDIYSNVALNPWEEQDKSRSDSIVRYERISSKNPCKEEAAGTIETSESDTSSSSEEVVSVKFNQLTTPSNAATYDIRDRQGLASPLPQKRGWNKGKPALYFEEYLV